MADKNQLLLYTAAYETVTAAIADLDAIEQLHEAKAIGKYDAAVRVSELNRGATDPPLAPSPA